MVKRSVFRPYQNEEDYWRIRSFLQEIFILNHRMEHSWHVARWDYLRWHLFQNCRVFNSLEESVSIWETPEGRITGVLHPIDPDEAFIHIHPGFRTRQFEEQIIEHAEKTFSNRHQDGTCRMYIPVDEQDVFRKIILEDKGYANIGAPGFEHYVDLDSTEPVIHVPPGFTVCSMGDRETHAARSWASWLSFHADEPLEAYDGDWSWYENVQRAPLYRRDLDIISKTTDDRIGSFCTLFYDDSSRSAVVVLDGTAKPFQRKGLGKAVLQEGLRRLKRLGCIRVFAKATDKGADAFYGTILVGRYCSETWIKEYHR